VTHRCRPRQDPEIKIPLTGPGKLVVRYNVPPSAELAGASGILHLMANFFDPGPGARVDLWLMESEVNQPSDPVAWAWSTVGAAALPKTRALLGVSSLDTPAGAIATGCTADNADQQLDFDRHVYYVLAVLTWDAAVQPQPPFLHAIQLAAHPSALCAPATRLVRSPGE
jgi:hypothetical protein